MVVLVFTLKNNLQRRFSFFALLSFFSNFSKTKSKHKRLCVSTARFDPFRYELWRLVFSMYYLWSSALPCIILAVKVEAQHDIGNKLDRSNKMSIGRSSTNSSLASGSGVIVSHNVAICNIMTTISYGHWGRNHLGVCGRAMFPYWWVWVCDCWECDWVIGEKGMT